MSGRTTFPGLFLPNFSFECSRAAEAEQELFESTPQGDPARLAIPFSHQEATQPSEMAKEVTNRVNRAISKRTQHFQPGLRDDVFRGEFRLPPGHRFHL